MPAIPAEIRARCGRACKTKASRRFTPNWSSATPTTAHRVMPNDRSRICRALEVVLATGRTLSDWHREGLPALVEPQQAAKVFLTCERKELVARIETRFAAMLTAGALEEVKALAARGLDPLLPAMKAHGVPWLIRHLAGEISLDEAAAGAVMDTRRYAKRQLTWFRNQMQDWPGAPAAEAKNVIESQLAGA